jgi:signal transduction histidine kinase
MTPVLIASWLTTAAVAAAYLRAHQRLVLVARATHELRGPLCAAQLGLHGVSADPGRVAAIELELRRAGRALDDLAAAPSGTRGTSRPEIVDLVELAEVYTPSWRRLAAAHGAALHVEPRTPVAGAKLAPTAVLADPLRIAQACANLVGNAAEHGGGVVRVRVRATGEVVRIEVADDGAGLPASVAALTAAARARHGRRGHGLAIAAAIAEHHGGRLAAAPSDRGARLMFEVPAARA